MCLMCMKNDVFSGRNPSTRELLKDRARRVKDMLTEAESNQGDLCYIGDAAVNLLKQEQYDLAKRL
jgi:hypothetical protein